MDVDVRELVDLAARPQHLLLTVLGDYWYPRFEHLPSAALVELLGQFGVSSTNARAALSRISRRGLLESERQGRRTSYRLTRAGMRTLHEGTLRIFSFGRDGEGWDGTWTAVAFSIPESGRSVRAALRTRLGWLGFAALFDAVWVAPGDRREPARSALEELGVESATMFVGTSEAVGVEGDPVGAWDLDGLRAEYEDFVARFAGIRDAVEAGVLGPSAALIARTAVIDVWREFPGKDPELPRALLPEPWPREDALGTFVAVYDGLAQPAASRVQQIVERHSPDLAKLVDFHTTTNALTFANPDI